MVGDALPPLTARHWATDSAHITPVKLLYS